MPVVRLTEGPYAGTRLRVNDGVDIKEAVDQFYVDKHTEWRTKNADKIAAQEAADREEYDPTKGMGTAAKLWAGAQQGAARPLRGALNMLGLKSDEDTAEANRLDEPLVSKGAGRVGSFIGNTAALVGATAPMGALVGAARAPAWLARTLGTPLGNATAQGAVGGAINADPGERMQGAAIGSVLGAGSYGVLKGVEKTIRGASSATSDALSKLRQETGDPNLRPGMAAAADKDSWLSKVYQVLEAAPISGKMLRGQNQEAAKTVIRSIVDDLAPRGSIPQEFINNPQAFVGQIEQRLKASMDQVGRLTFDISKPSYGRTVTRAIEKLDQGTRSDVNEVMKKIIRRYGDDPNITGTDYLKLMEVLRDLRNTKGGSTSIGGAKVQTVIDALENWGGANQLIGKVANHPLRTAFPEAMDALNRGGYGRFAHLQRVAKQLGEGRIEDNPSLFAKTLEGADSTLATGNAPAQGKSQLLDEVIGQEPHLQGAFRSGVQLGVPVGALSGAYFLDITTAPIIYGVLKGLGLPWTQRAIAGETAAQKQLLQYINSNPRVLNQIRQALAAGMTQQGN